MGTCSFITISGNKWEMVHCALSTLWKTLHNEYITCIIIPLKIIIPIFVYGNKFITWQKVAGSCLRRFEASTFNSVETFVVCISYICRYNSQRKFQDIPWYYSKRILYRIPLWYQPHSPLIQRSMRLRAEFEENSNEYDGCTTKTI